MLLLISVALFRIFPKIWTEVNCLHIVAITTTLMSKLNALLSTLFTQFCNTMKTGLSESSLGAHAFFWFYRAEAQIELLQNKNK